MIRSRPRSATKHTWSCLVFPPEGGIATVLWPPGPPTNFGRARSAALPYRPFRPIYGEKAAASSRTAMITAMTIDDIIANFALLDDWDDRYRYVIELGRTLAPFPEPARTEANKVSGCASQVWLVTDIRQCGPNEPALRFAGDSDAHIVRGLIAVLLAIYSGKPARQILDIDAVAVFDCLGLGGHLTPQRSNGFKSMVSRIRNDARQALALTGRDPSAQRKSAVG
jgi:cysteine desulfuration protein SufE